MSDAWENFLQLIIFTHNRSDRLAETLNQIANSPLRRCRITVLDNASEDETLSVCKKNAINFKLFKTIHRPVNIGAEANYFDALYRTRTSNVPFTWILCDDDLFNWDGSVELKQILKKGEVDAVLVGSPGLMRIHRGFQGRTSELIKNGCRFHFVATFVPGLVFRSSLVTYGVLQSAAKLIGYYWPSFSLANAIASNDRKVAVLSSPIVFRKGTSELPSVFFSWCRCALEFHDKRCLSEVAIKALFPNWFFLRAAAMTIRERSSGGLDVWQMVYLLKGLPLKIRLLRCWLLLIMLFPRHFFQISDMLYRKIFARNVR
jgi:glycosyltransferase involved in cell wall biosynthesis